MSTPRPLYDLILKQTDKENGYTRIREIQLANYDALKISGHTLSVTY